MIQMHVVIDRSLRTSYTTSSTPKVAPLRPLALDLCCARTRPCGASTTLSIPPRMQHDGNHRYKRSYAFPSGVIVTTVTPLGAAAKGGLLVDDVVVEIAGHKIGNDGTV